MITPPIAKKIPFNMTLHGETRCDNYYWLRDDQRENPEVLAYLDAENAYGGQVMASHDVLRQDVLKEIIDRIPQNEFSVPYVKRGWRYQSRYQEGNEYAIYTCQREDTATPEKWDTLLDCNQRAAEADFYTLGGIGVSPDDRVLAVAEDYLSRRQYGIRFRNPVTEEWYPEVLENVSSSFTWASDSQTFYYVQKDPQTLLPCQVWRHRPGTSPQEDELVYEEHDDTFYVSVHKTTSESYVLIALNSTTTSEILLLDAQAVTAQPQLFCPRRKDHEYTLDHYQQHFYVRSNREGKNFALYHCDTPDEARWQAVIPARASVLLEDFSLFRDWLVVQERELGQTRLRQICRKSGNDKVIAFDDPACVTWLSYNPSPETGRLRYGYSSMTTPDTLFELDMDSGSREILKQTEVKDFNAGDYCSERHWVRVRDGVEVPVSLVYRR